MAETALITADGNVKKRVTERSQGPHKSFPFGAEGRISGFPNISGELANPPVSPRSSLLLAARCRNPALGRFAQISKVVDSEPAFFPNTCPKQPTAPRSCVQTNPKIRISVVPELFGEQPSSPPPRVPPIPQVTPGAPAQAPPRLARNSRAPSPTNRRAGENADASDSPKFRLNLRSVSAPSDSPKFRLRSRCRGKCNIAGTRGALRGRFHGLNRRIYSAA